MSACEDCGQDHTLGPSFSLALKPVDGRELARSVASGMVEMFSQPSFRAGMVGSSVVGAVCLQRGMGKLPTFLLMLMAYYAAAGLYEMAEDIRDDLHALASRETVGDDTRFAPGKT